MNVAVIEHARSIDKRHKDGKVGLRQRRFVITGQICRRSRYDLPVRTLSCGASPAQSEGRVSRFKHTAKRQKSTVSLQPLGVIPVGPPISNSALAVLQMTTPSFRFVLTETNITLVSKFSRRKSLRVQHGIRKATARLFPRSQISADRSRGIHPQPHLPASCRRIEAYRDLTRVPPYRMFPFAKPERSSARRKRAPRSRIREQSRTIELQASSVTMSVTIWPYSFFAVGITSAEPVDTNVPLLRVTTRPAAKPPRTHRVRSPIR